MQHTNNQIGEKGRKLCEKPASYTKNVIRRKSKHPDRNLVQHIGNYIQNRPKHPRKLQTFNTDNYKISQEKQYLKRKLGDSEIELQLRPDTHKVCKYSSNPKRSIGEDIGQDQ